MEDPILRVIAMTNMTRPPRPTPERTAADNALDAWQRAALPVEHPAHLSAEVAAAALAAFVTLCPPPPPDYSNLATASDVCCRQAMRMPVMATSVSFMDAMAAQKIASQFEVSLSDATSIVTHLNDLGDSDIQTQSEITIGSIARKMRITPWAVKSIVRKIIGGN